MYVFLHPPKIRLSEKLLFMRKILKGKVPALVSDQFQISNNHQYIIYAQHWLYNFLINDLRSLFEIQARHWSTCVLATWQRVF